MTGPAQRVASAIVSDLPPSPTPRSVTAAAAVVYVSAALGIITGLLTLGADDEVFDDVNVDPGVAKTFAAIGLAIAVAQILLATRLRRGNRGARTAIIVLAALGVAQGVLNIPVGIIAVVVNAVVIYLVRFAPESKVFFGDPVA